MRRILLPAVLLPLLLCACDKPKPPPTDAPPAPTTSARDTQLRDAIQQPIDRAKAVEAQLQDAAARQQAAIDAQTGG